MCVCACVCVGVCVGMCVQLPCLVNGSGLLTQPGAILKCLAGSSQYGKILENVTPLGKVSDLVEWHVAAALHAHACVCVCVCLCQSLCVCGGCRQRSTSGCLSLLRGTMPSLMQPP